MVKIKVHIKMKYVSDKLRDIIEKIKSPTVLDIDKIIIASVEFFILTIDFAYCFSVIFSGEIHKLKSPPASSDAGRNIEIYGMAI